MANPMATNRQIMVVASMPQSGAVEYGFVVVVGVVALALALVACARRRDRHDREDLRAHIRRLGGPSDPSM